jgi:hypothetical protein
MKQKTKPNNFFFSFLTRPINKSINVSNSKHWTLPRGAMALTKCSRAMFFATFQDDSDTQTPCRTVTIRYA